MITGHFYRVLSNTSMPNFVKKKVLGFLGNDIGKSVTINNGVRFDSNNIKVDDDVLLNYGVQLITGAGSAKITIGKSTQIGPGSIICTITHAIGTSEKRAGDMLYSDVNIGKGVWIGANVTVLSGVTIGDGCVIGAGALVNKSTEPHGRYVGVPAKRIRDL